MSPVAQLLPRRPGDRKYTRFSDVEQTKHEQVEQPLRGTRICKIPSEENFFFPSGGNADMSVRRSLVRALCQHRELFDLFLSCAVRLAWVA